MTPPLPEQAARRGGTALILGSISLLLVGVAFLVLDFEGAVVLAVATLLGLVGIARGIYEVRHEELYDGRAVLGLLLCLLTGIGGLVLLGLLVMFLSGFHATG